MFQNFVRFAIGLAVLLYAPAALTKVIEKKYFGDWHYQYSLNTGRGNLSYCGAGIDYSNAWLMVRIHGEELDILLHRDDFAVPYGKILGRLIIVVDDEYFLMTGSTPARRETDLTDTTGVIFMTPTKEDIPKLFSAVKRGKRMNIVFPDESNYPVSLSGSGGALAEASRCWLRNHTGPGGKNPFVGSGRKKNPFDV